MMLPCTRTNTNTIDLLQCAFSIYNFEVIVSGMFQYIHHVHPLTCVCICSIMVKASYVYCTLILSLALVITNGPMNVTVCSGTNAEISCGFTGVSETSSTLPNWFWRIIKRNNDGYVISNETVTVMDINANKTDGLVFFIVTHDRNGIDSADNSYLSVGPVDDTYNNRSYQCIFTINDTIIESDTAGTITVIGTYVTYIRTYVCA